jgi:hypothetical protein
VLEDSALKEIQLEAAATKVKNEAGLELIAERPVHSRTNQARFFLAADDFKLKAGFSANAFHQAAIVASLARRSGGDRAVGGDVVTVQAVAEFAESAGGEGDGVFVKEAASERMVAEANGGAFVVEEFEMAGRSGARDDQTYGIRARVDGSQLNGSGHS